MVNRLLKPLKSRSFFVFGPRGVGKSTWVRGHFSLKESLYINLLDPETFDKFLLRPKSLKEVLDLPENKNKVVIIDEIQKAPKLLDIIHHEISLHKTIFVLTGSSARRLKQQGVNLLAGRASVYYMYALSMTELGSQFNLSQSLARGTLPDAYFASSEEEAHEYLKSYVYTYIEKEIQQEQWVRKLEPFRKFLQISAQMNCKILNKSKIATQIGVQPSTVESYYEILEDTLLGFRLPGFETSIRKQVRLGEKFYFFDTGVVRAIEKTLSVPMIEHTSYYGNLFETFVINEVRKHIEYKRLDWTLSYLMTKEELEVDLVLQIPDKSLILIEIKSTTQATEQDIKSLVDLGTDLDKKMKRVSKKFLISQDSQKRIMNGVQCLHFSSLALIFE